MVTMGKFILDIYFTTIKLQFKINCRWIICMIFIWKPVFWNGSFWSPQKSTFFTSFFSGELQCSFSHYFGMYCLFARCYSFVVMVGGKMLHGLQHCSEFMLSLCHQLRTLCCPSGSCPDPAAAGVPALLRSRTLLCSRRWEPWQCQLHHHFSSSAKWSCTQWVEVMSQCMTPSYRHSSHFQNTSFLSLEGCSRSIFPPCLAPLAVKWYE